MVRTDKMSTHTCIYLLMCNLLMNTDIERSKSTITEYGHNNCHQKYAKYPFPFGKNLTFKF